MEYPLRRPEQYVTEENGMTMIVTGKTRKARLLGLACCAAVLAVLALLAGCNGTESATGTATASDSRPETGTAPESEPTTVPATDTDPGTETVTATEPETEAETEPETVYDISKPEFRPELSASYCNVRDYGATGDGQTDDTDAVSRCLREAFKKSGVAYFPAGTYRITQTLILPADDSRVLRVIGATGAVLLGDEGLDGTVLQVNMKYNFFLYNLDITHKGRGSCVDALFIQAKWCRFTGSAASGGADVAVFHGSNCRFTECSFDVNDPNVYALSYVKTQDEISINNHVVDNVFRGIGKGVLVGNGGTVGDGRCEGLKINGNYFYNTGAEQVRVAEILHVSIAHNTLYGCTGSAIVLTQRGSGADGVYINDNRIRVGDGALACITTVEDTGSYISSVNINNNTLSGGQYGLYDPLGIIRAHVRENRISGQSEAGIFLEQSVNSGPYFFFDNIVTEAEGVDCFRIPGRGSIAFARNVVNGTSTVSPPLRRRFEKGCVTEKGDNLTRLAMAEQV